MKNTLASDDDDSTSSSSPLLKCLVDQASFMLVASTINTAKTAAQLSAAHRLPLSSTYKKIKKLQAAGILFIQKIELDGRGKKVVYYRSRIKSIEFNLSYDKVHLQFGKNDLQLPPQIANERGTRKEQLN